MPFDVRRDERRRWLIARVTGSVTIDEVLRFLGTARANLDLRLWPMLVDARSASTDMTPHDIEQAVAVVRGAIERGESRAHVALVADDDVLFERMLLYEASCADAGARLIRTFRIYHDAERWLEILSAARQLM